MDNKMDNKLPIQLVKHKNSDKLWICNTLLLSSLVYCLHCFYCLYCLFNGGNAGIFMLRKISHIRSGWWWPTGTRRLLSNPGH